MPIKYTNNAYGTLLSGISASALSFTLNANEGARFPTLAANDFCFLTFINASNQVEVVRCSARAGDTFTIAAGGRGLDGTAALAWLAGDKVECRIPRILGNELLKIGSAENYADAGGTVDAITATLSTSNTALFDGFEVFIAAAGASTSATPTLNLTLGTTATGAKTIVKQRTGVALEAGDIPGAGFVCHLRYDLSTTEWVLLNPWKISTSQLATAVQELIDRDEWCIQIPDTGGVLADDTNVAQFRAPFAATVTAVKASLKTASSSGAPQFDINLSGVSMLSTKITIDQDEKTSATAAIPAVISDAGIDDDEEITIDVDAAGTGAVGAKVYLSVRRA